MKNTFSPRDALLTKCSQAASAALFLTNDQHLRHVFNRHADAGPPLTLSPAAFNAAMQSFRASDSRCNLHATKRTRSCAAHVNIPARAGVEDFKRCARQYGGGDDVDLDSVFMQFADVGGLLSLPALTNALASLDIFFPEENSTAEHFARYAGCAATSAFSFVE